MVALALNTGLIPLAARPTRANARRASRAVVTPKVRCEYIRRRRWDDDGWIDDGSIGAVDRSIDRSEPIGVGDTTRHDARRDDARRRAIDTSLSLSHAIDADGERDGDAVDRARTRVGARTRDTGVSTIDAQTDLMSPDSSIGVTGGEGDARRESETTDRGVSYTV